jgi:hypothetical protein
VHDKIYESDDVAPQLLPSLSDPGSTVSICITSQAVPHTCNSDENHQARDSTMFQAARAHNAIGCVGAVVSGQLGCGIGGGC